MSGLRSITVGRSGCGKTTLSKQLLDNVPNEMPIIVYDINNEYKKYYSEKFIDFEDFLEMLVELKGHYILIEEATIFFSTHSHFKEMTNVLVRARHTKNIIQLNFHSFKSVPKNIYMMLDYITVFKTNDTLKDVKDKFDNPFIIRAFEDARQSPDKSYFRKTIKL